MRIPARALAALLALCLSSACAEKGGAPRAPRPKAAPEAHSKLPPVTGLLGLPSVEVTRASSGTLGPYLATTKSSALAVWSRPASEQASSELFAVSLSLPLSQQSAVGKPRSLGTSPRQPSRLVVQALAQKPGEARGGARFLLATAAPKLDATSEGSSAAGPRHVIEVRSLGKAGEPLGQAVALGETTSAVHWLEVIQGPSSAFVVWAEAQGRRADLFSVKLDATFKPTGKAERVVRGVKAWQAVAYGPSVGWVVVRAEDAARVGHAELIVTDAEGLPLGAPRVLTRAPTAGLDIDAVVLGERLLVAYSDEGKGEARLAGAIVQGEQITPFSMGAALGPQALLKVIAARGQGAWVLWEELARSNPGLRQVRVQQVFEDGKLGPQILKVLTASTSGWELEAATSSEGLVLLIPAPLCRTQESCESVAVPTLLQASTELEPESARPITLEASPNAPLPLAWNLACGEEACSLLAADLGAPTPVHAVALKAAGAAPAAPRPHGIPRGLAVRLDTQARPRLLEAELIASSDAPIAALAVGTHPAGPLLAWVTYFDPSTPYERPRLPAPDGRLEPVRAVLRVQSRQAAEPRVISYRAHSPGGVSLAVSPKGESLLVWTALDAGVPQVFATLLNARGERLQQRMLTRSPGEKRDVAAVYAAGGFIVGWVGEQKKEPGVALMKLRPNLTTQIPELFVSRAPGSHSDLKLAVRPEGLLVLWSSASEGAQGGSANLRHVLAEPERLSILRPEAILLDTPSHSHSPVLAAWGADTAIAWLETANLQGSDQKDHALLGRLTSEGNFTLEPGTLAPASGSLSALALSCEAAPCRGLALSSLHPGGVLSAFEWSAGAQPTTFELGALWATPEGSPLLLEGDSLFFAEALAPAQGRLRHVTIDW